MLSRPALTIRRLISPKKQGGIEVDEDPFYLPDEIDVIKAAAYKDGKGRTWKTPLMRRPTSKLNFDIPRAEDIHRISLIPPFPDTPHSSRSSLCSCENGANGTNHGSPRSSPGLPHPGSPRSSPLLRPRQAEQIHHGRGSSRSPPRIPMEPPHSPPPTPQPSQHRASPEPDSDLSDCIPRISSSTDGDVEATEQYLDKLIRETDEAFKLQDAFVDAKLPSPGLPEHREAFQDQGEIPLPLTPTRPTRTRSQRLSQSSLKSPTKTHVKPSLVPIAARSIQLSKTKRTRSKKSRRRTRAATSQPSRWALTESAKDFTIRIFSRIEADEMLPESTLREIRMSRASQKQWTKYNGTTVTSVETKAEHPARVDSLNARVDNPPTTEQVDTPRSSVSESDEIDRDSCATPRPEPQSQQPNLNGPPAADAGLEVEDDEDTLPIMMTMDDSNSKTQTVTTTPPAPPPKRNSPRRLPSRQLPPLPTIPEVIATGPDNAVLSPTSTLQSAAKINKDDYVFLPSTRYTITMPTFCHGPIRLAKADLPSGKKLALDDTLDWTAFQMAILGGAGDFFSEPTDYSRPSEAELDELEDIFNWFNSFGLGGPGSLVTEEDSPLPQPADRPRSISSYGNTRASPRMSSSGKRRSSRVIQGQQQQMQQRRPSASIIPTTATTTTNSRLSMEAPIPVVIEPPTTPKSSNNTTPRIRDSSSTATSSNNTPRQVSREISPKEMGFQPLMAEAQPRRYLFAGAALVANNIGGGGASSSLAAPRTLNHIGLAIDSSRRPSVDSVQSLPQSPMLDLVVSRDVQGDEYVVPMGFNLGHDLGDFLKWEAENVLAPGYGFDGQ